MHIGLLIYGSLDTLTGGYLYDKLMVEQWRTSTGSVGGTSTGSVGGTSTGSVGGTSTGSVIEVTIFSLPWRNYGRHLLDNFSGKLWDELANAGIDILIQDDLCHPSVIWLNRRLRRHVDYPIISLIHLLRFTEERPAWQNKIYRWLQKQYLSTVDSCIYNSHDSRHLVEALIPKMPGVVAYPGKDHLSVVVDEQMVHPLTPSPSHPFTHPPLKIITIGNVMQRKGLHTLLSALEKLPITNWQLTVIGSLEMETDYVAGIRRQIKQSKISENVQLLGQLPNHAIIPYLAASDLFVMVSQYEGFGIVYLEALAHGLPIIAGTSGAVSEIVRHEQEGFLVAPNDAQKLAHYLCLLCDNPKLLASMSKAAANRYGDFPTWAESAGKIRNFLELRITNEKQ